MSHHISDFVDHRKGSKALNDQEAYLFVKGRKLQKRTTKGWKLCAELSNGDTEWMDHDLNKRNASIRSNQWQKFMDVNTKVFIKLNYKKRDVYV